MFYKKKNQKSKMKILSIANFTNECGNFNSNNSNMFLVETKI